MTDYVRGTQVEVEVNFFDVNNNPVVPASVELLIYFGFSGGVEVATMSMHLSASGGPWVATWDSSIATAGAVYWSARSTGPTGAIDGNFNITANPANQSI